MNIKLKTRQGFIDTFKGESVVWEPDQYQEACMAFMLENPCSGAFVDAGGRKTSTTLGMLSVLKDQGLFNGAVIFATLNIIEMETWQNEIRKWGFDFSYTVLHGNAKVKNLKKKVDLYFINYDGIHWLSENISRLNASTLILDESSKAKRGNTKRFKSFKNILYKFDRRHLLTGTPAAESYENLWSQIYLLDEGERLGRYITHYRNKYFMPVGKREWNKYALQPGAEDKIHAQIKDIIFRSDIKHLNLKKEKYCDVSVKLPPKAAKVYKELEKEFITKVGKKSITAVAAGAKRQKLKQIANGQVYDERKSVYLVHKAKINAAKKIVKELAGNPILIGYEYRHDLQALLRAFPNAPFYGTDLQGRKPNKAKKVEIQTLWNKGKLPVLLGQMESVAHGLNLQEVGHNLMFFAHPDKLETVIQFTARLVRSGQKHQVTIHRLIAKDTVDEDIIFINQEGKNVTQNRLLKAMKRRLRHVNH